MSVRVPIYGGAKLYEYHSDVDTKNYRDSIGVILEKPGKFGLKNLSSNKWTITAPDGSTSIKGQNEVVVLGKNFKIDFGKGVICEVTQN